MASFHSYASRIGSKSCVALGSVLGGFSFPFIRFTNWKQEGKTYDERGHLEMFPFIRFTNWKQGDIVSDPSGQNLVSIHTLHELEARQLKSG